MKRIAYSFLFVALLSCGSSPSSSNFVIKIEFRDSVINDYFLLSVRDSALVITPYTTDYASIDSLNAHAQVVAFSKIGRLYKTSSASLDDELWFGATGCAVGGCYSVIPYFFGGGSGDGHPKYNVAIPIGGLAGGLVLGLLANSSYSERFLDSKEHIELVKSRAFYKNGEPPELQKIK
jgi:hypothetical protein